MKSVYCITFSLGVIMSGCGTGDGASTKAYYPPPPPPPHRDVQTAPIAQRTPPWVNTKAPAAAPQVTTEETVQTSDETAAVSHENPNGALQGSEKKPAAGTNEKDCGVAGHNPKDPCPTGYFK